ncbi:MAG: OB-fold domain-containing protein [Sphingomonadaceae bacterium]|nr:OB-fold domain-containing protein [Sphingomonadaceae bacterium]
MPEHNISKRLDPMSTRNTDWFWDEAAEGRLSIQQCESCKHLWHPPRPVCPECQSVDLRPEPMTGRGTIYSYIRVSYPPPIGFDEPPLIALVDLEEGGIRLITNIVDAQLEDIEPDAPVEVDFEKTASGKSLPVFRLVGKGGAA